MNLTRAARRRAAESGEHVMNARRLLMGTMAAAALAVALPWSLQGREARPAPQAPPQIASLSEPGQGLIISQRSAHTGFVSFAASRGNGILVSVQENALPETRARSFLGVYGHEFGIFDHAQVTLRRADRDALGLEHVRFQQTHLGVPVTAGELIVHLNGSRVMAANGRILDALPADVTPSIGAAEAMAAAAAAVGRYYPGQAAGATYIAPRLEVFNRGMLEGGIGMSRLAWFVEARGAALREYLWIDARTGGVLLNFSQLARARHRQTYDAASSNILPGTLVRSESDPDVGDPDIDGAHNAVGDTYDYFFDTFGRDSYDGAGATLVTSIDYCPDGAPCPFANSLWTGSQVAYGDGFAEADDVVAHEMVHAYTEQTAGFYIYYQSGALDESFTDIFGETIDLTNGRGTDTPEVRWLIGEDLPGLGAQRNMADPNASGDPAKVSDSEFFCTQDGLGGGNDNGGVHTNSGVPNKAYTLMADGGTFNGLTVDPIGLAKAAAVQYRSMTVYLTSGSTFLDNANALVQACTDLVGGTEGITTSDCTQVQRAVQAVEMQETWNCPGAAQPPLLCPSGAAPVSTVFEDDFEDGSGNFKWDFPTDRWIAETFYAADGEWAAFGANVAEESLHALRQMAATLPLPANARLHVEHSFDFQNASGVAYDGGVLEYSDDNGATWNDAGALIDGGQHYTGTISVQPGDPNPLADRAGFVFSSYGFTGSRLDLSSLAGEAVRFRFLIGTDASVGSLGWFVDNVRIYTCEDDGGEMISNGTFDQGQAGGLPNDWLKFAQPTADDIVVTNDGSRLNFLRPDGSTQAVVFQETGVPVPAAAPLLASFAIGNSDAVRKRISVLIHDANFSDLAVCTFWLDPSMPLQVYTMRTHTTKAWTGATISFYAATVGSGGFYQIDNVSMRSEPGQSTARTDCVDPLAPTSGGATSGELLVNGDFSAGLAPWSAFGNIAWQVAGGVFEFFKLSGLPSGVLLQGSGAAMAADQRMVAAFKLGNSSSLRQRVTILLHHEGFADLHACTFFLAPEMPLSDYAIRTYATLPWNNATVSVYPATVGSSPSHEWLRIDDVTFTRVTSPILGTECFEPTESPF
jgi:Zn-dependent metalloprotease